MNRVTSIPGTSSLPVKDRLNMARLNRRRARRSALRPQARVTRRDGLLLVFATMLVAGMLVAAYTFIANRPLPQVAALDQSEVLRRYEAQRQARRMGSILFMSPYQYCELHRFDNFTGNTVAIDYVDCESTVEQQTTAETLAAKAANMKDVLSSFKR